MVILYIGSAQGTWYLILDTCTGISKCMTTTWRYIESDLPITQSVDTWLNVVRYRLLDQMTEKHSTCNPISVELNGDVYVTTFILRCNA